MSRFNYDESGLSRKVNFVTMHQVGKNARKFKAGLIQASQELADLFQIRRLVMQMQKGDPPITADELAQIHRYVSRETTIPGMTFWQLLSRQDQHDACRKLKLCKAGIRGLDMVMKQTRAQSSINIMLKGQVFISELGSKKEVCISAGGVWGNLLVSTETSEWLARHAIGANLWFEEDDSVKRSFVMEEGVKYKVFLNPRSEYLSLTNIDIKPQLMGIQEALEQSDILDEMGLGFLNDVMRRRRRSSSRRKSHPSVDHGIIGNAGTGSLMPAMVPSFGGVSPLLELLGGAPLLNTGLSVLTHQPSSSSSRPSSRPGTAGGEGSRPNSRASSPRSSSPKGSDQRGKSHHKKERVVRFGRGAVILSQGDTKVEDVMVVTKGVCRVVVDVRGDCTRKRQDLTPIMLEDTGFETKLDLRTVSYLTKKAIIGDIPALLDVPQPAYVITDTDVTVVVFGRDELREGLHSRRDVLEGFRKGAMENLALIKHKTKVLQEGLLVEEPETVTLPDDLHAKIGRCGTVAELLTLVRRETYEAMLKDPYRQIFCAR